MFELLSGFIGALIATVLSVVYLYIAEQAKIRTEIALDVVAYCDDIYDCLQLLHTHKGIVYTHAGPGIDPDKYRDITHQLSRQIKATTTRAKLEITFGAGPSMALLNKLSSHFREAASVLRNATEAEWTSKNSELLDIFQSKIDPLRADLQRKLINGTRASAIARDFLARRKRQVA